MLSGVASGFITAILQTKMGVNSLLSGIIVNTALYSVNIGVMGGSSILNMNKTEPVFTRAKDMLSGGILGSQYKQFVIDIAVLAIAVILGLFLRTRLGLAIRATGNNPDMERSYSINPALTTIVGLCVANSFTALSGCLIGEYNKFCDINLGTGMVVIGLASLIIGETRFGRGGMWVKAVAAVAGSVIYRFIIALALRANVPSECLKLISAVIVALAIAAPALKAKADFRRRRANAQKGGARHA